MLGNACLWQFLCTLVTVNSRQTARCLKLVHPFYSCKPVLGYTCTCTSLAHALVYVTCPVVLLCQDGELNIEPNYMEQFSELNQVLDALTKRDVEPALR